MQVQCTNLLILYISETQKKEMPKKAPSKEDESFVCDPPVRYRRYQNKVI